MSEQTVESTEETTEQTTEQTTESTTASTPEWLGEVKDESLRSALTGFESRDKALEAIGYKAPDWRDGIEDEKLQGHAKRFNSVTELAKSNMDLVSERDRLKNTAVVVPGKDASEEEVAAFHQKIGVPESPEGYEWPEPAEGEQLTEHEQESRKAWAERFHKLGVPKGAAEGIVAAFREDMANASQQAAQIDKQFAEETQTRLKREWGQEYDRNSNIAKEAAEKILGDDFEPFRKIIGTDDKILADNPILLRMFAKVGREMQEGGLGAMSDDERAGIDEEISTITKQIQEAQASGDSKRANELYQREQQLRSRKGNQPIVGAEGRAA